MMLFVSNCLSYIINYIWFINIILNINVIFIALKKRALVIFCSMRPLVASGEKPKLFFFPLTEIMPFKFEYNLNIDNILVQNSNLVFQPI